MGLALTFTVVLAIAFAIHGWIEDPGRRLIRAAGRGMVRILARS